MATDPAVTTVTTTQSISRSSGADEPRLLADPLRGATPPRRPRDFFRWLWRLILDIIGEYQRDGVGDQAASITFWTLLSIPAATLALVSTLSSLESIVGSAVSDQVEQAAVGFISDTFVDSQTLQQTVRDLFNSNSTSVATAAGLIAFISASGAFAAVIRALDRAYGVRNGRPWWYMRLVAVVLGVGTLLAFAGLAVTVSWLPVVPGTSLTHYFAMLVVFVATTAWVTILFHVAPNQRSPWSYDIPGAMLTTVGWVLAVQGFRGYLRLTRDTNEVQSAVGGVIVFFTFIYALAVVMLVGAELNDVIEKRGDAMIENPPIYDRLANVWRRLRGRLRQATE